MKKPPYLPALLASALFLTLCGCESTPSESSTKLSSELSSDPAYRPIPKREPVITGQYYKEDEVDAKPRASGGRAAPQYPLAFKRRGITGEAKLAFVVTVRGDVEQLQVTRATHAGLGDAAMEAVKQWRFKPATKNGQPVNCLMTIPIVFSLGE